mgnify:FL=1
MSRINNLRVDTYRITESESVDLVTYEDDVGSTKVIAEGEIYYSVMNNIAVMSVMDDMTIEIWNENLEKGIENFLFTDYKSVSLYWGDIEVINLITEEDE